MLFLHIHACTSTFCTLLSNSALVRFTKELWHAFSAYTCSIRTYVVYSHDTLHEAVEYKMQYIHVLFSTNHSFVFLESENSKEDCLIRYS